MLARWPIRVKLLTALVFLSAIVGLLALSGFWGLYGYRHLATVVSERAAELPLNSKLTRAADTLRDSCHRLRGYRLETPSRDAPFPSFILREELLRLQREESQRFEDALINYRSSLTAYRQLFAPHETTTGLYADSAKQLALLDSLAEQLTKIDSPQYIDLANLDEHALSQLQNELHLLVEGTERLPRFLHDRMSGFRSEVKGRYRTMIGIAWSSLIAAIILVVTLLALFRRLVVKPFRALLAGSRIVAKGELDHRIQMPTGDEFAELAQAMNEMTDRFQRTYDELEAVCRNLDQEVRDRSREAIQREQLASVGFLAAGVAHEINNPLASIAWSAEALESRLHDLLHHQSDHKQPELEISAQPGALTEDQIDSLRTNLRRIQDEAFRCKGITERLLDFSRLGDVRRSTCDLTELVSDVVAMVSTIGQYRCKSLRLRTTTPVYADVNPQQIKQVVLNLLTNALESVDTEGEVNVSVVQNGDHVRLLVEDNGCGMTAEVREHLFEPFFTRRRDGRGTGLGLSITCRIVNQHGGQITAHSDGPGQGSRLEVLLPVCSDNENALERRSAA